MTNAVDKLFLDFQAAVAGRYSLERELGRGGMGVVYLAREVRLDRLVAIKVLPPARATDKQLRERFLREARTAAKLSHPNIVPIHAVDEVQDFVFFAMAFVDGETLTARVQRRGPLPPFDATKMLREVSWALAYAHAQGVIHRDIKPDNILLETGTGRALVTDFGIAAVVRDAPEIEGTQVTGTPEFMSPEQALGEAMDGRSDLYALGLVGYFTLTGRLAFSASDTTEVLARQVGETAPSLLQSGQGVPRRLAQALDRCLAKDPASRPANGEDLADQLSRLIEQRREVPVPLRVFVKRSARVGVGAFFFVYIFGSFTALLAGLGGPLFGLGIGIPLLVGLPLAVTANRTRRLSKLGFGPEDVAAAFQAELDGSRDERTFEWGQGPSGYERVLRWITGLGLGVGIVASVTSTAAPSLGVAATIAFSLVSAAGAGALALIRLVQRRDLNNELWLRLWRGPKGRGRLLVGGRPPAEGGAAAGATHRPTEMSLSLAADQLFQKLDKATRKNLGDLPSVLRRLEADARRMRARLDVLQDALAGASDHTSPRSERIRAELVAERDLVQQRLGEAVAALETIRLGLLRLHAGTATVHSVTTDLGLAAQVAEEVDRLLDGRRDVERLLRPTPDPERA